MRLIVFIILAFLCSCEPTYVFSGPVGKSVRKEVRDLQQAEIDLKKIVPFYWDALHLYGPYTPREMICNDLGIPKDDCRRQITEESIDDGEMFLVFQRSGEIIHQEMHLRFNGDFAPVDFVQPVTPDKAVFDVKEDGVAANGEPWLKLRLRSSASPGPLKKQVIVNKIEGR